MNLDLNGYRLHLVFSPTDMRNGYRTLSAIASSCLQLDISEGKDCVVFVSARRTLCKAIWADAVGASMVSTLCTWFSRETPNKKRPPRRSFSLRQSQWATA